jgi:hypothetical protein
MTRVNLSGEEGNEIRVAKLPQEVLFLSRLHVAEETGPVEWVEVRICSGLEAVGDRAGVLVHIILVIQVRIHWRCADHQLH